MLSDNRICMRRFAARGIDASAFSPEHRDAALRQSVRNEPGRLTYVFLVGGPEWMRAIGNVFPLAHLRAGLLEAWRPDGPFV